MAKKTTIQHYYTTGTTAPSAGNLALGEVAVGAGTGNAHLYIKENGGTIRTFSPAANNTISAGSGKYFTSLTQTDGKLVSGETANLPTFTNTDSATTESGHYTPSNSVSTTSANSGYYVSGIKLDSKQHVVGITEGTVPTSLKNPNSLKVGSKSYDGSSEITITASDLGLGSALKYHGKTTTSLSDGATTNPIVIDGSNHTATTGCVVFSGNKEFVWNGSSWEELGNEGSYKVVQTAVADPSANGNSTAFIDTISQDSNGKITVTKSNVNFGTHNHDGVYLKSYTESYKGTVSGVTAGEGLTGGASASTGSVGATLSHAKKGPSNGYTSSNTTTSINGSGASATIKIPQITVDSYGHVTAASDENVTITMPTIPTSLPANGGNADTVDNKHAADFALSGHNHDDRYYTETEINNLLAGKSGTGHSHSNYSLTSHTHNSYVNQNAFSNVKVGSTNISADSTADTIEIVAGAGIELTPDATNDKVTIKCTVTNTDSSTTESGHYTPSTSASTVSAGSGKYVSGIKLDSKKHVVGVTEGTLPTNTDSATTESGHYTPSTSASTTSAGSGKYISGIKLDSKKHVVGVTEGTLPTNTDTHYSAYLRTASATTSTANTTDTADGVYFNLVENGSVRSNTLLSGDTFIDVKSPTAGTVQISIATGTSSTTVARGDHSHSGYSPTGHSHSNYSLTSHTHSSYAASSHTHNASAITEGTINASRLPSASHINAGIVTTGRQEFNGIKTFRNDVYAERDIVLSVMAGDYGNEQGIYFGDARASYIKQNYNGSLVIASDFYNIGENTVDGEIRLSSKYVIPDGHNFTNLGSTNLRFSNGYFSNQVYATNGFYQSSDERLKTFGDDLKVDIDALSRCRKSYFSFNGNSEEKHIGVSAQEIQKLYPEVVTETSDGYLNVDYAKLSVIALAAIDQLNERLKRLEEKLS